MLPLELLATVLTFLPDLKAIATCACVSRLWRQAAGQAVPRKVWMRGKFSSPAISHREELSRLLLKPCGLSAVTEVVITGGGGDQFLKGALFARICTEAAALRKVSSYDEGLFDLVAGLVPVNLRSLTCGTRGTDLALLSRLTQLKELICGDPDDPLTQPLPQLPALRKFRGFTADLQLLSSVSSRLETLELMGCEEEYDFRQPITLAHFTRLHTLFAEFGRVRNFHPDVLPSTLRSITWVHLESLQGDDPPGLDQSLVLPAGGQVALDMDSEFITITWKRTSPL